MGDLIRLSDYIKKSSNRRQKSQKQIQYPNKRSESVDRIHQLLEQLKGTINDKKSNNRE